MGRAEESSLIADLCHEKPYIRNLVRCCGLGSAREAIGSYFGKPRNALSLEGERGKGHAREAKKSAYRENEIRLYRGATSKGTLHQAATSVRYTSLEALLKNLGTSAPAGTAVGLGRGRSASGILRRKIANDFNKDSFNGLGNCRSRSPTTRKQSRTRIITSGGSRKD